MDFPGANLRGVLYCGVCDKEDEVAATNTYRLVHKERGDYYYLDQRHTPHSGQRTNLPSWLIHRLIMRVFSYAQEHRMELRKYPRGVPYRLSYPDQDRLDALLAERKQAIVKPQIEKIADVDKKIRLELERQQLSYERKVRISTYNPKFLQVEQVMPSTVNEFTAMVMEVIPQIFVYESSITILTNFGMVFDFEIPAKPNRATSIDTYSMEPWDLINDRIGAYLKQKYASVNSTAVIVPDFPGIS